VAYFDIRCTHEPGEPEFASLGSGALGSVASAEGQLEYERGLPIADVPGELICGFAGDLYDPRSDTLRDGFNDEEFKDLAEFYGRVRVAAKAFEREQTPIPSGKY
jgi:hypothetical protein